MKTDYFVRFYYNTNQRNEELSSSIINAGHTMVVSCVVCIIQKRLRKVTNDLYDKILESNGCKYLTLTK